jgi:hypothetical protein
MSTKDLLCPSSGLLSERQAAAYLRVSYSKLRRMRKQKTGPVFVRNGRSLSYRISALEAFLDAHSSNAA